MVPKVPLLLFLTASNFGIAYLTGILVARALGVEDFDEYAVAVAAVTMLSTLAEFGTGKYAMRVLPAYVETEDWGHAHGYRRFAHGTILLLSLLLAAVFVLPDLATGGFRSLSASSVAVLFLPAMALVGYGAEVVQANQATVRAAVVSRFVVPGVTLIALVVWDTAGGELSATRAIMLFGAGWVAGLLVVQVFLRRTTPGEVASAQPVMQTKEWIGQVLPFLAFALLVVALAKAGIVVLKMVAEDEEVSVFSAALETGSFLYLIAKSTDKMFLPQLSVLLERGDIQAVERERRRRLRWVGAVSVIFLGAVVFFGREILGLFGPGFEEGHTALVVISAATAVWTLFSLAPSYLKYVDRKRFVVVSTGVAVIANLVLTWVLGARYGSVGAAFAYGVPIVALYGIFTLTANRHLRQLPGATGRSLEQEDEEEFPF